MRAAIRLLVFAVPVITVIGLFLSSISQTRDRERQTNCLNNLRYMALGMETHNDNLRRLPSDISDNYPAPKVPGVPWEMQTSWIFALLPMTWARMDNAWSNASEHMWGAEEAKPFFQGVPPHVICPNLGENLTDADGYGLSSYVGISGIGKDAHLVAWFPQAGFFGVGRKLKYEDIKDGKGSTLLFMETMTDNGPWAKNGYATIRGVDPDGIDYLGRTAQFSSLHTAGGWLSREIVVQGALCDSSAKAFRASMSPWILEALATIAGGEELPGDWQW